MINDAWLHAHYHTEPALSLCGPGLPMMKALPQTHHLTRAPGTDGNFRVRHESLAFKIRASGVFQNELFQGVRPSSTVRCTGSDSVAIEGREQVKDLTGVVLFYSSSRSHHTIEYPERLQSAKRGRFTVNAPM